MFLNVVLALSPFAENLIDIHCTSKYFANVYSCLFFLIQDTKEPDSNATKEPSPDIKSEQQDHSNAKDEQEKTGK